MIKFIKTNSSINISAAGYPEGHNEAENLTINYHIERFDFTRSLKIDTPIIPGILPITSFKQTYKMTQMCHASIPKQLFQKLEKYQDEKQAIFEIGFEHACTQVKGLIDFGVNEAHFYTLNKATSTENILKECL